MLSVVITLTVRDFGTWPLMMPYTCAGVLTIVGGALGQLLGGVIPRVLRLGVKGLLRQCIICLTIAGVMSFGLLLRCDGLSIAGINVPYQER